MNQLNNLFDNISRIGSDNYDKTNKQIQNNKSSNYVLENYNNFNTFHSALNLANNQPNVFLNGSPCGGINSSVIDDNSKLKNKLCVRSSIRDNDKERLFKTSPYLGKGPFDIDSYNKINNIKLNSNKKTNHSDSETRHDNYTYTPLISSIESTIANPSNCVEGVAYKGWIRGGMPSRLLNREVDKKMNTTM